MSQENVEIVRRYIWAFVNDLDTFRDLTHPKIAWAPVEENHTPSHGIEGALRIRNGWLEAWDEYRLNVEEILDAGDEDGLVVAIAARSLLEQHVLLHSGTWTTSSTASTFQAVIASAVKRSPMSPNRFESCSGRF